MPKYLNIATIVTLIRLAAIPFVALFYFLPVSWAHPAAAIVFALAALTDWLDGYLARSLSLTTRFGAFLDPVTDKLLVCVSLVMIMANTPFTLLALPAAVIICREIVISALREWMAEIGKRTSVAVSLVAKIKTTLQMVAIFLLLWPGVHSPRWIALLGLFMLFVAAALTLWSMVMYLKAAWLDLTLAEE